MVVAFILFYSFFSCTIKQREEKEEGTTNWLNSVWVSKGWKSGGGGIPEPVSISCRGVWSYLKAQYVPSGSDRFIWSAKIWVGNFPLYSPISYAPDYVIDFIFKNQFLIYDFFYLKSVFKCLTTSLSWRGEVLCRPKRKTYSDDDLISYINMNFPVYARLSHREKRARILKLLEIVGLWLDLVSDAKSFWLRRMGPTYLSIRMFDLIENFKFL